MKRIPKMHLVEAKILAEEIPGATPDLLSMSVKALGKASVDHAKLNAVHGELNPKHPDLVDASKTKDKLHKHVADLVTGAHNKQQETEKAAADAALMQAKAMADMTKAQTGEAKGRADAMGAVAVHAKDAKNLKHIAPMLTPAAPSQPDQIGQDEQPGQKQSNIKQKDTSGKAVK